MVVHVIDVDRVPILEPKRHPPFIGNRDGKVPFQRAFEWMQTKTRKIHTFRIAAAIQNAQYAFEFLDMIRGYSSPTSTVIKGFKSTMAE